MPLIDPVTQSASHPPPSASSSNVRTKPAARNKPYFSTLLAQYSLTLEDVLILSIYPATCLLGQLFQSVGTVTPSYFSSKRNIFNIFVIKQAWAWVSLLAGLQGFQLYRESTTGRSSVSSVRGFAFRYIAATMWWFVFSQWFFGNPLMDRVFRITGGGCAPSQTFSAASGDLTALAAQLASVNSYQCKRLGHSWNGGIDPSGHMFIICHGSLYLWYEIMLPALNSRQTNTDKRLSPVAKVTGVILLIFWWMLFMTNVYDFHSFFERILGLLWGYVEVLVVYIGARHFPVLQGLLN